MILPVLSLALAAAPSDLAPQELASVQAEAHRVPVAQPQPRLLGDDSVFVLPLPKSPADGASDRSRDAARAGAARTEPGRLAASVPPPAPGDEAAQGDLLQMRVVAAWGEDELRVEVDLQGAAYRAWLLISASPRSAGLGSEGRRVLAAPTVVAMERESAMTFVADLSAAPESVRGDLFLQAIADGKGVPVRISSIASLSGLDAAGANLGDAAMLPPLQSGLVAITRIAPLPGSYALHLGFVAPSNDWALRHLVTRRHADGSADVHVLIKRPAEGEGRLDVTVPHDLMVDLGPRLPHGIRVHAASSTGLWPNPAKLAFRPAPIR